MKLMNVGQAPVIQKAQIVEHTKVAQAADPKAQVAQAPAKAAKKLNIKA